MQIKKLADELEVGVTAIKRALKKDGFLRDDRTFKGSEVDLTRDEERAVRAAYEAGRMSRSRIESHATEAPVASPDLGVRSDDLAGLRTVATASRPVAPRGDVAFPIFLHQDVLQWTNDPATPVELRKVFTRRLQELMAHGAATRTKGTRGKNAGWLRTPLGGNGGNQFYLWLCNAGELVREHAEESRALYGAASAGARFLRAVRHHDATKDPIDVGSMSDYCPVGPACAATAECDGLVDPLVPGQRAVADDTTTIRIIVGRPGAGKTTSLQAAANRLSGRALYVTWSSVLAERAREWFHAYAPADLQVEVMTFRAFLGRVDPSRPLPRELTLPEATEALQRLVDPVLSRGPWRQRGALRTAELFAEFHAHLVGRALPVAFDGRRASTSPCLAEADYRTARSTLGEEAAQDALRAFRKLGPEDVARLFAAPVEAFERARALQDGRLELGSEFAFDWILVDEAQDLTLAELWLLIDVAARSGRARGVVPGLIFAGDEAQTVRPTAFEFAPLRQLLRQRFGRNVDHGDHSLVENLRSPETIARLVDSADSTLYGLLPRRERPRGARSQSPWDVTVGRVAEITVRTEDDIRRVFDCFKEVAGDAALVYPGPVAPSDLARVASDVGVTLWTSETIKGLEFRSVGVLAMPETVRQTTELASSTRHSALASELARSQVDRLLVALSRATETLVLVGSDWATHCAPLRTILAKSEGAASVEGREGFLGSVDLEDLPSLLELDAADTLPRIENLLTSSARFLERGHFEDALREAENARGLIGTAGRPGSAGRHVRMKAHRQYALALMAAGLKSGRPDLIREASRAFHAAEDKSCGTFATALAGALGGEPEDTDTCERLRDVALGLERMMSGSPELGQPLAEAVRERVTSIVASGRTAKQARGRAALVQALHCLAKSSPTDREAYEVAHQRLLRTTLEMLATRTDKAHREEFAELRGHLVDPDLGAVLDATHAEANGDYDSARILWEKANRAADALRCAREHRDFREGARLAAGLGHDDAETIAWARDLAELLRARPAKGRLSDSERAALTALARSAWMSETPGDARTKGGARHA